MSIEQPITASDYLFVGDDAILAYAIDNGAATPAAVDITGWALEYIVRDELGVIAYEPNAVITDGPAGELEVEIVGVDTDALTGGPYSYALRRTDTGLARTLAFGRFTLRPKAGEA